MGHRGLSAGQIINAALLGLEDGGDYLGPPPSIVRILAVLLQEMLTMPFVQESPYLPKSEWWGCSDASASDHGDAYIGGWISIKKNPMKSEVYWFHYQLLQSDCPWAFKDSDPKKQIAAIEFFGARIPMGNDSQGNVYSILNLASKKAHTAAILMELVLRMRFLGCTISASHVPREQYLSGRPR